MDSSGEKGLEDLEKQFAAIRKVEADREKELKELQERIMKKAKIRDELNTRATQLQQQISMAKLSLEAGSFNLDKLGGKVKEKYAENMAMMNHISKTESEIIMLKNKMEARKLEMEQEEKERKNYIERVEVAESKLPERVALAQLCETLNSLKETETAINTEGTLENKISNGKALEDVHKEKEEFLACLKRIFEEKQFLEKKLYESKRDMDAIQHEIRSLRELQDPHPSTLELKLQQLLDEEKALEKYLATLRVEKVINKTPTPIRDSSLHSDNNDSFVD